MGSQTRYIPQCTRRIFCRFTTTQKESCPCLVISYGFFSAGNPRISFYRNGKTFHSVTTNTWKLHLHKGSFIYFFFFLVSQKLKLSFVKVSTLSVRCAFAFRETVYIYSRDDRAAALDPISVLFICKRWLSIMNSISSRFGPADFSSLPPSRWRKFVILLFSQCSVIVIYRSNNVRHEGRL